MDYKEYIYMLCTETDFSSKDSVTEAMQFLAMEAISNRRALCMLERGVKKLLTAEQFENVTLQAAREMVIEDVDNMEDGEIKEFVKEHINEILGEIDECE